MAAEQFHDADVLLLVEPAAAELRRDGHAEDTEFPEAADDRIRNQRLAVDGLRIDAGIGEPLHAGVGVIGGRLLLG